MEIMRAKDFLRHQLSHLEDRREEVKAYSVMYHLNRYFKEKNYTHFPARKEVVFELDCAYLSEISQSLIRACFKEKGWEDIKFGVVEIGQKLVFQVTLSYT